MTPIDRGSGPVTQPLRVLSCRKYGNVLDVSGLNGQPVPADVLAVAGEELQFEKKVYLFGAEQYAESTDGRPRKVKIVHQQLYTVDKFGRLVCGYGFLPRLTERATALGYDVRVQDISPPRPNPDCYVPDWDLLRATFTFRDRQEECMQAIAAADTGVVHAVTGFGKMVLLAMTCMMYPRATHDVVVRGVDLARKTHGFLTKTVPGVGFVGDGDRYAGRVTVYTAGSLHHCPFESDFLLCDEVHELLADTYSEELGRSTFPRRLAFSASPGGRADGTDMRLESLFGRRIFYISYPEAVALKLVVPIRVEWSDVHLDCNPCAGMDGPRKERHGLWTNVGRNAVIAARANEFAGGQQVQILVRTIEHAIHLRRHLPDFTLVYGDLELANRARYVRDGLLPADEPLMTAARRDELRKQFEAGELKKVISTSVWATGIDPVNLAALIRADAGASEIVDIQAPGRVARVVAGKEVGIVCDFRDQFDDGYAGKAKKREKHYRALGWEQATSTGRTT